MKHDNGKSIILFLAAIIISSANLLSYSLSYIFYGNDNIIWMIWSFSNYFVFCFALYAIEKITHNLIKKKKYLFRSIMIPLLAIELIVGFYISTFSEINYVTVILITLHCLFVIAIILCGIFCHKKVVWKQVDIITDEGPKRDVESDIYLFYTKNLIDTEGREGMKVGFSLICVLVVYISVLAGFIFANIVCKKVSPVKISIACILSAVAITANQIQIILTSKKIILGTIIENGLLVVALASYFIVEWILLPVTFNFLLCLACVLLMLPIHIKFGQLSKAYYKYYK